MNTSNSLPSKAARTITLLVQPERDDRDMYAEFLRYEGLQPVCASTGIQALAIAHHADIVVTGLLLPGEMDGFELIRRLRNDARTTHIPIVVLTTLAWKTERERAARTGCDVFLSKPCLPETLLTTVRRLTAAAVSGVASAREPDIACDDSSSMTGEEVVVDRGSKPE